MNHILELWRVKGKRCRKEGGKIKVFALLKKGDKVNTQMLDNCSRKTLQAIIKERNRKK